LSLALKDEIPTPLTGGNQKRQKSLQIIIRFCESEEKTALKLA
jgi:hypothetical protein